MPRQVQRVLESQRFRAGYDFLLLRAQLGHLGEEGVEVATWWGDMYAANGTERHRMIEELRLQPKKSSSADGESAAPKKRRRRRKPKAKTAAGAQDVPQSADNAS